MLDCKHHTKMKPFVRRLLGAAVSVAVLYSCASVGRLEGGPIDEEPPRFVTGSPLPGALHNKKSKISIEFDEFIKLEKANEKVVISPPQVQQPEIKANGKRVVVNLQDTLKANTTYTIDFADAIQDNNEGNPMQGFTYTFSTGAELDSMAIAGTLLDASNLEPVKGVLVGLHANLADSAFTTLPFDRVGRTDSRGQFSIRGVSPGKYRIYALMDADQNFKFSQPTEVIAFNDSVIIPSMERRMRQDTLWRDSLTIDTIVERQYTHFLPDDVLLRSFKEKTFSQRLMKTERLTPEKFSFYFTAPADSLPLMKGLNFDEKDAFVIEQTTGRNDTIHYWIKDSLLYQQDTLRMSLSYLYTDTLNQLVPRTDTLRIVSKVSWQKLQEKKQEEKEKAEKEKKKRRKKGEEEPEPTPFFAMDVYAPSAMDVYDYITLSFMEPIAGFNDTALHVRQKVDTLWQDVPFDFMRDSLDLKRYNLYADWKPGESYVFEVDSTAFHGLYGLFTDKVKKEFTVKKLEEYGQIFFNITGADSTAFVELLDAQDKVVRTVPVVEGKADFYYLNPGKYGARLINDTNGNGVWDTGDYAARRQPEMVYYYPQVLEFKANFDLIQDWNVKEKPLDKQKPDELKKQKPDEDKKKRKARITATTATVTAVGDIVIKRQRTAGLFLLAGLLCLCSIMPVQAQCVAKNEAFQSGEHVMYDLYFNWKFIWKKVGLASLTTNATTYRFQPAYRFNLLSVGSKKTDFFFKMRDTLTCYVSDKLEPLYFRKAAEEGKRYTVDEAWFSYDDGIATVKQRRTWHNPVREPQEMEYSDSRCIFDMLSILAQARSYNPKDYKIGEKILFPMATGRRVEEQTLIYRGKEDIEANNDTIYRCLVFSFVEYKKGKEKEVITFFISDDKNHLPIRLDMYLNFGSAKAFLKSVRGNRYPMTSVVTK